MASGLLLKLILAAPRACLWSLPTMQESMNIDVTAKLAEAEATLVQLQAAISASSALATIMSGSLVTVSGRLDDVKASVDALVAALSYDTFHPVRCG